MITTPISRCASGTTYGVENFASHVKKKTPVFLKKDILINRIIFIAMTFIIGIGISICIVLSPPLIHLLPLIIRPLMELSICGVVTAASIYISFSTLTFMEHRPRNSGRTPADYTADCLLQLNFKSPMIRA